MFAREGTRVCATRKCAHAVAFLGSGLAESCHFRAAAWCIYPAEAMPEVEVHIMLVESCQRWRCCYSPATFPPNRAAQDRSVGPGSGSRAAISGASSALWANAGEADNSYRVKLSMGPGSPCSHALYPRRLAEARHDDEKARTTKPSRTSCKEAT